MPYSISLSVSVDSARVRPLTRFAFPAPSEQPDEALWAICSENAVASSMKVSSPVLEAYLECSTKCWLRSRGELSTGNAYAEWGHLRKATYCEDGLKYLLTAFPDSDRVKSPQIFKHAKDATWRLAIDVLLQTDALESRLPALERTPSERQDRPPHFVPHRFQWSNKVTKNDKLLLAFDALVLAEAVGSQVNFGKIMHGGGRRTLKVNLSPLARELRKQVANVVALTAEESPPDLVLNAHCRQCEFQARCHNLAKQKDELSLLSGMSQKERKKLHGRGIFTVTQLSYTFRPRRRRRQSQNRVEKFHHSLRALAIRENKIHAVDIVDPKLDGTPVYLDVEGLPDRDFYYLTGIRVGSGDHAVQYSFWADDKDGERCMWNELLDVLSVIPDPKLVHFGRYETTFLKKMFARYGGSSGGSVVATAIEQAVNLLSLVFAHIYFPTFSNGLKDIAGYLGFRWSGSPSSGLEAIVWRHRWEALRDPSLKQALYDYNRQDCEALALVASRVTDLHRAVSANCTSVHSSVILASEIKRESPFPFRFGRNAFAFPELEIINRAAYWHYQRERVCAKGRIKRVQEREPQSRRRRSAPTPNTIIECPPARCCPTCASNLIYCHGKGTKIEMDIRFMRHGVKRWITRNVVCRYRCQSCRSTFYPSDRRWTASRYGPAIAAYAVYQNIELGLPQGRVAAGVRQMFGLDISRNTVNEFKAATAQKYASTYDDLLKKLCSGRVLHVDETRASVKGKDCYVWVLTSMEEVAYFHTPNREGGTIQAMLRDFSGVLVSDFYAAYDAIECPQQKCLIHLIRDLNDELLKHPFDDGLKQLVGDFAGLIKPMVETVNRRGLKKRFLGRHRAFVDRFYRRLDHRCGASEAVRKVTERLTRSRNTIFTFLDFDGVPWNNNNAEHAIKAFAELRRSIDGKTTESGLRDFLVLLSVWQTCKYKNVDFLGFLRSGSGNVDDFAISRRPRRSRSLNYEA
jgi:predicted RecB family nuclease